MNAEAVDDDEAAEEMRELEDRIEALSGRLENCRKVAVAARIAAGAGALLLVAGLAGAITFDLTMLMISLSAIIGGLVLLGSNRSTADEASAALATAEAERVSLINSFNLRIVGSQTLH